MPFSAYFVVEFSCHDHTRTPALAEKHDDPAAGAAGARTSVSAPGRPSAKITALTATPGTTSRTTSPAAKPTVGARTASPAFAIAISFSVFAPAFWNGKDPILKERLFGLTRDEGNHGEDVKEYYFHLDSTPTHSYMRFLYKYPQAEFPYG